jgi:hypothetical protein
MSEALEIRKAIPEDAALISLRASDLKEALDWAPDMTPQEALRQSIEMATECFTGTSEGAIVSIWGYRVGGDLVHPWLMCSDSIKDHAHEFLKDSRKAIQKLQEQYPDKRLCNFVGKDNSPAKKLLTFLGFEWLVVPGLPKFDFFYKKPPTSCAQTQ